MKPHLPFTCPQKYWDLYPANTIKLPDNYHPPKNVPEPALHNWYELRTYGGIPATGGIPDETALNLIRGYRACISFMDAQVGRVLDELDRLGLRENTIVVFLGDHGYHLGENGIFTKMTNFELGTHAPLIVSAPGMKTAGQRTRALVEFVDIYPTLAELAGLPLPPHLEGTSFAPLLAKPDQPWKKAAFSQYLRPGKDKIMGRSMRTDRWRYTEWANAKNESVGVELYDEAERPEGERERRRGRAEQGSGHPACERASRRLDRSAQVRHSRSAHACNGRRRDRLLRGQDVGGLEHDGRCLPRRAFRAREKRTLHRL